MRPFVLALLLLNGCALFHKRDETTLRIHEQASAALPAEKTLAVEIPKAELKLAVSPYATVTERDVQSAELYDTAGGKAVFLQLDPHGIIKLDELTTRARGQYIVTFINSRPIAAWLVNQRILNGQLLIEGDLTDEQAKDVVDALNKLAKKNR